MEPRFKTFPQSSYLLKNIRHRSYTSWTLQCGGVGTHCSVWIFSFGIGLEERFHNCMIFVVFYCYIDAILYGSPSLLATSLDSGRLNLKSQTMKQNKFKTYLWEVHHQLIPWSGWKIGDRRLV